MTKDGDEVARQAPKVPDCPSTIPTAGLRIGRPPRCTPCGVKSRRRFGIAGRTRLADHCAVNQLILEIPDEIILAMRRSPGEVGARLRMAAGAKLFELGELSSGAAAALAGVPRVVFLSRLAEFGVDTFSLSETEILRETRLA